MCRGAIARRLGPAPAFAIAPPGPLWFLGMAIASGLAEAAGGHPGLASMKRKRGRGRFAGFGLCATGPIAGGPKPAGGPGGSGEWDAPRTGEPAHAGSSEARRWAVQGR